MCVLKAADWCGDCNDLGRVYNEGFPLVNKPVVEETEVPQMSRKSVHQLSRAGGLNARSHLRMLQAANLTGEEEERRDDLCLNLLLQRDGEREQGIR